MSRRAPLSLLLPLVATAAAAADYAGADACRPCHAAQFTAQSRSAHAHAAAPSTAAQPGDWAFGAGVQAITFVSRVDREHYREHGETWYRSLNGYGITPGHRNTAGIQFRLFDPAARILRCFACHTTGPLTLGTDDKVVPQELGVRCEICHGPAAVHVRDPAANHPRNPGRLTAAALNDLCGQCHRLALDLDRPTDDLADPRNSRNQPLLLAASTCFRRSKSGVSCVACHSPHAELERNPSGYDAACASCHASPRHSEPPAGRGCVSCHMPKVPMDHLVYTNHRIAVYAGNDPVNPVSAARRR